MQIESFATQPLQSVIPSYLYAEYSDDEALQAFVSSFNGLAQGYLDWFNTTPLSVYTSPNITGPLLDWIGLGIYGIPRPVISTLTTRSFGEYNTVPYNTLAYNGRKKVQSGTAEVASDDLYKRVLTWHLYLGDGRQMSLQWLRRRVARFIFGANGSDIPVDFLPEISLQHKARTTLSARSIQIGVPAGQVSQDFKVLLNEGYLALPFQVKFSVVIRP
jgi:hypothetical protein